ncbi:alaserpin isoform X3 [Megachile rotundata]|uniref:alaserpin isoform X3 n=1 Tax=Megachile rotundata TaxID=143995 RepID=UPI003FD61D25
MRILKESFLGVVCLVLIAMAKAENVSQALSAVSQGSNQFSSALFQTVAEQNSDNLIMSPLSAAIVLAMAAYGSRGETENQFRKVLHLPSPDSLGTSGYQALIDNLNSVKENKLDIANKVFAAEKFSVNPEYKKLTESYFRSITQLVNFAKSVEAASTINQWVEQNTNNRIKDIISPDDLDESTAMVLVNAVYFKGQWKKKFDPENTKNRPFHINADTVKDVPTMFVQSSFRYGELPNLQAKFIVLPYKGDELSMVIILPNEINGLAEVEKKLQNTNIKDILNEGYVRDVHLYLPKFKVESKMQLKEPLRKLGLTDMFTSRANFSGIADAPLMVSKVVQKAFIEVNEEGSEAAAATVLGFVQLSSDGMFIRLPRTEMRIDRPYLFFIIQLDQDIFEIVGDVVNLFQGYVINPQL